MSRRRALVPLAAALAVPGLAGEAHTTNAKPAPPPIPPPLPDRYDEALGIGLEGWPYPAPLRWQPCSAGGQPVRMAYMDVAPTAKARNKVVVLLHGRTLDSSYWAGPIRDLGAAGFRVIVPDQIGFHKSSKPDVTYSLDMLAELTTNLLGGQQIGKASFIGHSIGGMLAIRIAATFPDKVDRLVLESPIGLVDYRRFIPPQQLETLIAGERRRTVASYRAFVRTLFPILPPREMEPFVEWRMRMVQSGEYERFLKTVALTTQMVYRESVRDQLPDIKAPTLMIVGEKDQVAPLKPYAPPEMAAKMPTIPAAAPDAVKAMAKASLLVVPGVGHVPHLEAPDTFRKAMLDFLLG